MKKREVALVVPCLAAVLTGPVPRAQTTTPAPPVAARKPHTTRIHGHTLTDDYFWLREKNHIVVSEREGGLTQLRVMDPKTKQSYRIETDEPDFALSLAGNPEFDTKTVRFNVKPVSYPSTLVQVSLNDSQVP